LIYFLSGKEGFAVAIPVVLYISITKIITAATGCTNNIINNSKYYYFVPFLSIGSAIAVVFLNLHFIEQLGFIGAAFSTFVVITTFNIVKVLIVGMTFKITPFSRETFYLTLLITGHYYAFSMVKLPFNAFVNLLIKSSLISGIYLGCCVGLNISPNINELLANVYKKLRSILG
jgi:O-antigen/teichoic acid export membrane protein